jgi:hypothetical protein
VRPGIQQALLKPAFARLYPGVPANEWQPVPVMLDLVRASRRHYGEEPPPAEDEVLNPEHFELRGRTSAGSREAEREDRSQGRKRRPK